MIVLKRSVGIALAIPVVSTILSSATYASPGHSSIYHNSPVTAVTQTNQLRATTRQLYVPIRTRIDQWRITSNPGGPEMSSLDLGVQNGLAAGDISDGIAAWTSIAWGNSDEDTAGLSYTSDIDTYSLGIDTQFNENLLGGLSFSYSDTSVRSDFNNGKSDSDDYSLSPYVAYRINDLFSIDAAAGYTWTDTDMKRNNGTVTGSQDGSNYFYSLNLTADHWFNLLNLAGRVGYLYSKSDQDSFTESDGTRIGSSDSRIGQLQANATVSYYTENLTPYFSVTYEKDNSLTKVVGSPNDDSGMVYTAGVNIYGNGPLSGGFSYTNVSGRRNIDDDTFSANLSYQF